MLPPQGLSRRGSSIVFFWFIAVLVVILDQATKAAVRHLLPVGTSQRTLIPGILNLAHVENTGAAFSIGEGSSWLFVACAVVAFGVALGLVWNHDLPFPLVFSLGCVVGGGVGNMIDRLALGSVTDFLATAFIDFPVFNVADIFVTCGVAISLVLYMRWEATEGASDEGDSEGGNG